MAKRFPLPGYYSYADLMEHFSCSHTAVRRLWKVAKVIPPPREIEGIGLRWLEDEILPFLVKVRAGEIPPPRKARQEKKEGA